MKSLPSLGNHPVLKGKDDFPSSSHHHLLLPSSEKSNEGFSMATRNHFKSLMKMGLRKEWYREGRNDNSCIFISETTHCVSYLPLFGSCLCRSKYLPPHTPSVYLVSTAPLSERESASAACQPVLVIRVMPASLPPL